MNKPDPFATECYMMRCACGFLMSARSAASRAEAGRAHVKATPTSCGYNLHYMRLFASAATPTDAKALLTA